MTKPCTTGLWWLIGLVIVVVPLLPIAQWVGAPDAGPNWGDHLAAWSIGIPVVLLGGLTVGRVGTHVQLPAVRWPVVSHGAIVASLALLLAVLSALATQDAFAGNPHLTDEVAQLFQARVFASGRLAAPSPAPPQFFLIAQTLITPAGWVAQYPPGQAMLLAAGMAVRLEWLVNPLLGGVGVVLVYVLARRLYDGRTGLVAALLWSASAWVLFMSATYMNHVGATTLALAAWAVALGPRAPGRLTYLAAGALLAAAVATRPLDGVAAGLPLLVWLGARRRLGAIPWMAVGALPLAAAWAYLNWRLYGSPLTLGYTLLYGPEHGLGFHEDPWGRSFTPLVALSNLAVAMRRLHIYVFEWPIPALLPLGIWALAQTHRSVGDLVVAAGVVAAPLLYFFYWHSGFYPGPRFYYLSAPFLVIGTARAWSSLWPVLRRRSRWGIRWDAALAGAAGIVLVWSVVSLVPARWSAYRSQLVTLKQNPQEELVRRGVSRALVLVPESWSSRVATALRARGAPAGLVERVFARADGCELHQVARWARAESVPPADVIARLEQMLQAPGSPVPRLADWPDPALRIRRNKPLPEECRSEMQRDLDGFTIYGHLAWRNAIGLQRGIVFARDRFEENDELLSRYRDWPLWRYAPPRDEPSALPVLSGPLTAAVTRSGDSP